MVGLCIDGHIYKVFNTMNVRVALRYPLNLPLLLVRFLLDVNEIGKKIMFYTISFQVGVDLKKYTNMA